MSEKLCVYYNPHMETIKAYVRCLYDLKDCNAGGMLHILLDDNNIGDSHILHCLSSCIKHPEKEESAIGILICEEFLKLSMDEREFLMSYMDEYTDPFCYSDCENCRRCPRIMWCKE